MTFTKFIPISVMIGLTAAAWVYIGSWAGWALWVPFISWAMYFAFDPTKPQRIVKEVIGLTGGIVFGYVTLVVMPIIGGVVGSIHALPITVFLVASTIVTLELTDWFELAPAYFFSYAGYFAYVFGGMADSKESALIPFWFLIMVGLGMGFFTAWMRRKMLEKEGVYGSSQKTVFDKEQP